MTADFFLLILSVKWNHLISDLIKSHLNKMVHSYTVDGNVERKKDIMIITLRIEERE
jgi:hypothetical protein